MAIKRFYATKDTTITNAYKSNLASRATTSNMGASDILEVFSIYGQATTSSNELSKTLIEFDTNSINSSRNLNEIPASGSVNFYVRMFNAPHSVTTPENFTLNVAPVLQSWDEGNGLDMDSYSDPGIGYGGQGSTWLTRKAGSISLGSLNLDSAGTEYVQVSDADSFTFSNAGSDSPFSFSAWIYIDDLSAERPILSKYTTVGGDSREWYFFARANPFNYLALYLYDENNDAIIQVSTAANTLSTGTWYHVVVTYDGTGGAVAGNGVKIYINGVSKTLTVTNNPGYSSMVNTTAPVEIGAITLNNNYFDGKLDEISIWSKVLTNTNITEVYNQGVPNNLLKTTTYTSDTTSKLVAWWRMEKTGVTTPDTTTTIYDRSGNSRNGTGQNLDSSDLVTSDYAGKGLANEINTALYWSTEGGDFTTPVFSQSFNTGFEDLIVDVTDQVEEWLKGNSTNNGFGIYLTSSVETQTVSYYTKKFFGRGSEFFFKRPVLEARWNDSKKDNRNNFTISSSILSSTDNLNTLYLYNVYKGQYKNLQGLAGDKLIVSLYRGALTDSTPTSFTASKVETGIYSASVYLNTTASTVYDVWSTGSTAAANDGARATQFYTGSFEPNSHAVITYNPSDSYIINITNLKSAYETNEKARFRIYARNKNWNPTVYTVASTEIENSTIENLYYRISREADNLIIVDFSTGSLKYSLTSYDSQGNYFDFDMSLLEPNYSYVISFLIDENGNRKQTKNTFRFRVEESNE